MDHRSVLLLMMFVVMPVATFVDCSTRTRKPYILSDTEDHRYMYGLTSVERPSTDFSVEGRNLLDKAERDTTDVEALLSIRKAITFDPYASLSSWTANNSDSMCSWNGVLYRQQTKRVIVKIARYSVCWISEAQQYELNTQQNKSST